MQTPRALVAMGGGENTLTSSGCIHMVVDSVARCDMPATSGNDGGEGIEVDPLPCHVDAIIMMSIMFSTSVILEKKEALNAYLFSVESPRETNSRDQRS